MTGIRFFGCRHCGQTANRVEGIGAIVAVLAEPWPEPFQQQEDTLYVNMTMRPAGAALPEFDRLEIRPAPSLDLNEQLGHILRSAGNDAFMNPEKLKTLPVTLVAGPALNQNSLNLLSMRFASVKSVHAGSTEKP